MREPSAVVGKNPTRLGHKISSRIIPKVPYSRNNLTFCQGRNKHSYGNVNTAQQEKCQNGGIICL